jgi:hypothetical protein
MSTRLSSTTLTVRFVAGLAACALTPIVAPFSAEAAPLLEAFYGVAVGNNGCLNVNQTATTGPLTVTQNCSAAFGATTSASSRADFGSLGTELEMTLPGNQGNSGTTAIRFTNDYIFTGPGPSVAYSLNLDVEGRLEIACALSLCIVTARINGPGIAEEFRLEGGIAAALDIDESLIGTPQVVGTNTPVPIQVSLSLDGGLLAGGSGNTISLAGRLLNTVTFNQDGPVFDLPAGFTVNGPCVIDNIFTCGDAPSAVPEPSSIALLAFGAVGALTAVRRRRTS